MGCPLRLQCGLTEADHLPVDRATPCPASAPTFDLGSPCVGFAIAAAREWVEASLRAAAARAMIEHGLEPDEAAVVAVAEALVRRADDGRDL